MSRKGPNRARARRRAHAVLFAALGDKTRLALVGRLSAVRAASITQLTADTRLTRQAITKHLRVLERAGIVHSVRSGRESRFELHPDPIGEIQNYLDLVSHQWDRTLGRLKAYVED